MQVRKQQLELDMEQQTGSKLRKEYIKAVYCHPAYLTCLQSHFYHVTLLSIADNFLSAFVLSFFPSFNTCLCWGLSHGDKADPQTVFLLTGEPTVTQQREKATDDVQARD